MHQFITEYGCYLGVYSENWLARANSHSTRAPRSQSEHALQVT